MTFHRPEGAAVALEKLHKGVLGGRIISVSYAYEAHPASADTAATTTTAHSRKRYLTL